MKTLFKIAFFLFWVGTIVEVSAQNSSSQKTLLELISLIEEQSEMRFLYREALVSNIKVSVSSNSPTLYKDLEDQLSKYNIGLQVDTERNQALLYKSGNTKSKQETVISGYVVDAETGDRLPYSTISWFQDGEITGVASSTSGTFSARIRS
ncbi:MAG TPA: hypothetical protein DEO59_04090, partial [Balneola sp.]|nr:hypothetical protein [Balneola sp.]